MINRVVLVGRLTKDPDMRYTPNGVAVATFTLAVNRPFSGQSGEREADFINCVVWRKQAENTANFLRKGSLAGVEGRMQTRSYDGQDGKRVYVTEVVCDTVQFLEPKGAGGQSAGNYAPRVNDQGGYAPQSAPQAAPVQSPPPVQNPTNPYQGEQPKPAYQSQDDPFASNAGKVDISDNDLPF
ncbi:MAG: single-stranded DNA-binding protein [Bacilli bacterium]